MKRKLINVCEDLTVGGQVLHIKELEGKWLTDEEGGEGEGIDYRNLDWYYVIDDGNNNYIKANVGSYSVTVDPEFSVNKVLGVFGFEKGYIPTSDIADEVLKDTCKYLLQGTEFSNVGIVLDKSNYFILQIRYSLSNSTGNDGIGRSIWYVPDFGEQAGQLVNVRVLAYSDDRSYVYPEMPQPGTYYISSDDFSPVEDPFVGDDEEEYKSNFVAKFRVTGENVMKNRYSRFEDPDGIILLRL